MHLLIWRVLPSSKQKEDVRAVMSEAAIPPQIVANVISAFPFVNPQTTQEKSLMILTSIVQA